MNNKETIHNSCECCRHAVKDYMGIGCTIRFSGVRFCLKMNPDEMEKPFKIKTNCEKFAREGFPTPTNIVEERLDYLSRQIVELRDTLLTVLRKTGNCDNEIVEQLFKNDQDN